MVGPNPTTRRPIWPTAIALGLGIAVLGTTAAGAQPFVRFWGGYGYGPPPGYAPYYPPPPYGYDGPDGDGPYGYRAPPPAYRQGGLIPPQVIAERVAASGMRLIAPPRHNGRVYLAEVENSRGQRRRLVFNAYTGALVQDRPLVSKPKVVRRTVVEPHDKAHPKPLPSEATKSPIESRPPAKPDAEPEHAKATTGVPSALEPSGVSAPPPTPAAGTETPPAAGAAPAASEGSPTTAMAPAAADKPKASEPATQPDPAPAAPAAPTPTPDGETK